MAPLHFLTYCVFTSALVSGQSIRYELVGLEVNLKPDISGQPDQILWMHNGNKVVEFDGKEEQVYGSYAGRVTLDWISAELHIRDLIYEDSGEYELEVFMNKNLLRSQFTVEVIDKVSKPTISCQMNDGSSSNTPKLQATLMCSADSRRPQSLMKFEWIPMQPGPKLTIPLRNKQDDEVYSCRVSNPLSQETANFIAKDCYPDESSNVPLVASICALVILFIALVLGILFWKWKHKACFAEREGKVEDRKQYYKSLERNVEDLTQYYESLERNVEMQRQFFESFKDKNTDTNKETVSPPVSPVRKPSFGQDFNNLPSNDTDAEPQY